MPHHLLTYVGLVVIIILIPGPDMTLAIRNGLAGGKSLAFWTGLGASIGLTMWGALSVAGLAALVAASEAAYNAVKFSGVAYLIWMGASSLWHARRGPDDATGESIAKERFGGAAHSIKSALTQGILSNALNPKVAVFYLTLIPQFIDKSEPHTRVTIIFAAVFVGIAVVFYRLLSIAVAKFSAILVTGKSRLWIERTAGVALVGLGIQVAITS